MNHKAFCVYFHDRFICVPDLLVLEFGSYLTNFLHLLEVEAAVCEMLVTHCKVRDMLKLVCLNKWPVLDVLHYTVYLRILHIFVTILTDVFNHWFVHGVNPGSISGGVIRLLKEGSRDVWKKQD